MAFVEASSKTKTVAPHKLYYTLVWLKGKRAVAVCMACIQTRKELDGIPMDQIMFPGITKLPRTVPEYFKEHVYVTSGFFHKNPFEYCVRALGADNIMYSVDYPYLEQDKAREFLETAPYTEVEKEKIAHANAEKLFRVQETAETPDK